MQESSPSKTAEFVCLFRALEKRRGVDARILDDPHAHLFLGRSFKAALRAARLDSDDDTDLPNRVVDFVSLEAQIRRFLEDIGGRETMVLPPCDKSTRAMVHELATAFNLKSQSKGKGKARYTTLIKKTNSGINVNEKKVRRIMRQATGTWDGPDVGWGSKRGGASLGKQKEGEVVGKVSVHFHLWVRI